MHRFHAGFTGHPRDPHGDLTDGGGRGLAHDAAMVAALQLSHEIDEGVIVTVFPDGGARYLSTVLYD